MTATVVGLFFIIPTMTRTTTSRPTAIWRTVVAFDVVGFDVGVLDGVVLDVLLVLDVTGSTGAMTDVIDDGFETR